MDPKEATKNEREGYAAPGPETKGGGGGKLGPKRWTGRGPPPARHIPWPEIFRHHISLIEGHLKMTDMVRKHTVEGSDNNTMICDIIERTKKMLSDSRHASRKFVPPPKDRNKVPLGSSSVSMYPGYSPADHVYGEAAQEYGIAMTTLRNKGQEDLKGDASTTHASQPNGIKRPGFLDKLGAPKSNTVGSAKAERSISTESGLDHANEPSNEGADVVGNPFFVIDTNPTPVNVSVLETKPTAEAKGPTHRKKGRKGKKSDASIETVDDGGPRKKLKSEHRVEAFAGDKSTPGKEQKRKPNTEEDDFELPASHQKPSKKTKQKHDGSLPAAPHELEDISDQVDARLKEKVEKGKRDKDKKRKRHSEGKEPLPSVSDVDMIDASSKALQQDDGSPKKKKKKMKHADEGQRAEQDPGAKKRKTDEESTHEERPKQKRGKKSK